MDYMTEFAQRLKAQREALGLTQAQLAEKVGVTSQTISAYEKNSSGEKGKTPTLDKVVSLAQALGVSIDYLCGLNSVEKNCTAISLRDIAESLIKIASFVHCYGGTRTRDLTEDEFISLNVGTPDEYAILKSEMAVFTMDNRILANFLKTNGKLIDLYNDGALDRELYDTIIEGQLSKLQDFKVARSTMWDSTVIDSDKYLPEEYD